MTAIVGLLHDGKILMGGDSAGSNGYMVEIRSDPKVFVNAGFAMGYTGSFRAGQLLQYVFSPPDKIASEDNMTYMIKRFVPEVKGVFSAHGIQKTVHEICSGEQFLVGHEGDLYNIGEDYQVARCVNKYAAVGSGEATALGSLHTTEGTGMDPAERVTKALEAAAFHIVSVSGPFHIVTV